MEFAFQHTRELVSLLEVFVAKLPVPFREGGETFCCRVQAEWSRKVRGCFSPGLALALDAIGILVEVLGDGDEFT